MIQKARDLGEPVLNNTSKYLPNGVPKILIAHEKNGEKVYSTTVKVFNGNLRVIDSPKEHKPEVEA